MKYRLKDAELQRKLDEITNGEFSKNLQFSMKNPWEFDIYKVKCGDVLDWEVFPEEDDKEDLTEKELKAEIEQDSYRTIYCRMDIFVRGCEVETEFDPAKWNDWPETQPPSLKLMRVEYRDKYGSLRRTCAQFSDVCSPPGWIDFNGNDIEATELKFRPWED